MSFSKNFLDKQQKTLLSEKVRLTNLIENLKKYPNYGDRDEDNTLELVDYENNLSLEENLAKSLKEVNFALKSIEKETYGQCRKCSEMISKELLEIMPAIELCSKCQKK